MKKNSDRGYTSWIRNIGFIAVPTLEKFLFQFLLLLPVPDPDITYLAQFYNNTEICTQSCLFNVRSSIVSQNVCLSFFICIPFYVGSGSKSLTEPECISVPIWLRQKVAVPVPQHTIVTSLFSSFFVFSVCSFFYAQFLWFYLLFCSCAKTNLS